MRFVLFGIAIGTPRRRARALSAAAAMSSRLLAGLIPPTAPVVSVLPTDYVTGSLYLSGGRSHGAEGMSGGEVHFASGPPPPLL